MAADWGLLVVTVVAMARVGRRGGMKPAWMVEKSLWTWLESA